MKDEIIKPDAVAQNAMAAVKACKGTPVDKLIILVLTLFHNIGQLFAAAFMLIFSNSVSPPRVTFALTVNAAPLSR